MKKVLKNIVKYIKKYNVITIHGHYDSDVDSIGSIFGLKEWININFKDKKVFAIGAKNTPEQKSFYPKFDNFNIENTPYLSISVDVNRPDRIDLKDIYMNSERKICIDHHNIDDISIYDYYHVDKSISSNCELVAKILLSSNKYIINKNIATYLYGGMVFDTFNFYYERVNDKTFQIASKLIKKGNFNPFQDVNRKINEDSIHDYELSTKIFNKLQEENGIYYFILTKKDLEEMKTTSNVARTRVNEFNRFKEVDVLLGFCQDEDDTYSVSLRSKEMDILKIAKLFGGGGVNKAAGTRSLKEEEIKKVIKSVNNPLN